MVMHMIRAVAPTSFSAGSVEFSEEDYRCSITAAKLCTVDVEVSLELFLHRTQDTDSSINSHAKTILVVISNADITTFAVIVPNVIIDVHGAKSASNGVDKVQLRDGSTDGSPDVTKNDILVAPTKFIVGDKGLTPKHIQQSECLMYRRDLGKQEAYPRDLLVVPNANVQPADSPTQQDDHSLSPDIAAPAFRALAVGYTDSMTRAAQRT
ncbi:hypothetical protein PHLGIDRAFT_119593 [Phlebiopsis gigantea 11061_1 CR5-6]|uniref:Uncharacterized protein n=1 Tax=Phlebiopsis gigantea (strain 11061_1 CR5-6) TaxID=745531 RepID=A0A0C3S8W5_PHLG1|nr:hypothetical protein PHLGIDRAFT_119593 [Phlebiopsis gigantea 11061_1 CR5-6]